MRPPEGGSARRPSPPPALDAAGSPGAGLGALPGATPRESSLGLYIHVPFCVARCHFCSFNTAPLRDGVVPRFLEALDREIDLLARMPWAPRFALETVFLGGGTPSLLEPAELAEVLERVRCSFRVLSDAEITVEANPETVTRAKLEAYRAAGVTRLSIGVESLDDGILQRLGRLHTAARAHEAFQAARAAGVPQVSLDLMYGLPGLDTRGWGTAVERVLDWAPDHLSAYGLTLDPGSQWGSRGVAGLPSEDAVVEQYWTLARAAAARGYEHYEISNYARPGGRSRHNQIYWRRGEYLALGPGACGFLGDVRYQNVRSAERWAEILGDGVPPVGEHERLTERQQAGERLMLGLRTRDGVPARWLADRADGDGKLAALLAGWQERDLLEVEDGRARLTEGGFLLSDALFVELL